eukprot:11531172-Alexandrium_andersonii.AAC.1
MLRARLPHRSPDLLPNTNTHRVDLASTRTHTLTHAPSTSTSQQQQRAADSGGRAKGRTNG